MIRYNVDVMRQTVCLCVNLTTGYNFAASINCTTVILATNSMRLNFKHFLDGSYTAIFGSGYRGFTNGYRFVETVNRFVINVEKLI